MVSRDTGTAKEAVKSYWESQVCDTKEHLVLKGTTRNAIPYPRFSRDYFEEIERRRVASRAFAEPEKYRGKKVLEVGVGSGVDFVQWVRRGADAYGVDLTDAAVRHTRQWLATYDLGGLGKVQVADAEKLPYLDGAFDLCFSWGCLHHTPDTLKAIRECVRVAKRGGEIKLMLYNAHSVLWVGTRVLKMLTGKDVESPGTKAFTKGWVRRSLYWRLWPCVRIEEVDARTCAVDLVKRHGRAVSWGLGAVNRVLGSNCGFFMTIRMRKL